MKRRFPALWLSLLCAAPCAFAQISLGLKVDRTVLHPDRLDVRIGVNNEGSESAHDVVPRAFLSTGEESLQEGGKVLAAGDSLESHHLLTIDGSQRGTFPLFVRVDYEDANAYPFTAVLCTTYSVHEGSQADIFGHLEIDPIEDKGILRLRVKNLASASIRSSLTLFAARELSFGDHSTPLLLQAGQEKRLEVDLYNFSALPGSRYPVYAVLQYQQDNRRHTFLARGQVEIRARLPLFTRYRSWIAGLAGLLLMAGFAWVVFHRRRRSTSAPPSRHAQQ